MMEVQGYYGVSRLIPCEIFVYGDAYCIAGSRNVNYTRQAIMDGVHIETVEDYNHFEWGSDINSVDELREACDA